MRAREDEIGLTEMEVLRRTDAGPVPPSVEAEAEAAARARLRVLIAEEQAGPAWRAKLRDLTSLRGALAPLAVGATAVIFLVAVAALALTSLRPPGVLAQLTELARVAEAAPPSVPPAGSFVYGVTAQRVLVQEITEDGSRISFLHSAVRETWLSADARLRVRTTNGDLQFFSEEDAASFADSALAALYVPGEVDEIDLAPATHPETNLDVWSTDPDTLETQLDAHSAGADDRPREVRILESSADLLRSTAASPALRAAVLRVLADLPGLEVSEIEDGTTDETVVSVEYTQAGARLRHTLLFDGVTAHLVEQRITALDSLPDGVPAGTEVSIRIIQPPVVVDSIPSAG